MEKQINDKIKDLNEGAGSQEELMKSLAQIDEEGQLTDDVLDAVSGGTLGNIKFGAGDIIINPPTMGFMTTGGDTPA
jgi:hypothetical protein